ncbi:MAG TPA: copper resistance protein B [Vicinamibacterales bacterium]|nr:copper resistance protein B [Vicinamibacterales bacterium]
MTQVKLVRRLLPIIAAAVTALAPALAGAQDVDHGGHTVHDRAINFQVLFDQLEVQFVHGEPGTRWDSRSWIGGDIHRIWVRTEGEALDGVVDAAEAQVLYGRSITRWWDVVAGVRFDARPSPSHTWAAIGVQGLAPQFLDVQATMYVGDSGHVAARFEVEHDMHITQKLVLQPLVELSLSGSDDEDRGIGKGLSTAEVGFRFRYEFKRELAPYAGVVWHRKLFGTGDFARERRGDPGGWHLVGGVRFWL